MKKRLPVVVLAVIMLAPCMTCSPVFAKSSTKSPALIKSVIKYEVSGKTNKWKKSEKTSYTYKKKYPTKASSYDYYVKDKTVRKFSYKFSGKVPKKMTLKHSDGIPTTTYKYTKRGLVSKIAAGPDKNGKRVLWFIYGNKNYFTTVLHDYINIEEAEDSSKEHNYAEEIDSVAVTTRKNGLLKKTVNHGLFANYTNAEKRKWFRFDGTYTVKYDTDGIANLTTAKFKTFPGSGKQLKFKVYKKNGLITKVIRYIWDGDAKKGKGAWSRDEKLVFTYTKTKIDKIRYASMINAQIMDENNNYYMYNWY